MLAVNSKFWSGFFKESGNKIKIRSYPNIQHFIIFVADPIIYPFWLKAIEQIRDYISSCFFEWTKRIFYK